ncbi:uncharacterized, partial [Tachysurus ichikawai]
MSPAVSLDPVPSSVSRSCPQLCLSILSPALSLALSPALSLALSPALSLTVSLTVCLLYKRMLK